MRHFVIALLCAGLLALGGCQGNFPTGQSLNRHMYQSTVEMPINLRLIEANTQNELWLLEVPVGTKAAVELGPNSYNLPTLSGSMPAKEIRWALMKPDDMFAEWQVRSLPGTPVRLLMELREREAPMTEPLPEVGTPLGPPPGPVVVTPVVPVEPRTAPQPAEPQQPKQPDPPAPPVLEPDQPETPKPAPNNPLGAGDRDAPAPQPNP